MRHSFITSSCRCFTFLATLLLLAFSTCTLHAQESDTDDLNQLVERLMKAEANLNRLDEEKKLLDQRQLATPDFERIQQPTSSKDIKKSNDEPKNTLEGSTRKNPEKSFDDNAIRDDKNRGESRRSDGDLTAGEPKEKTEKKKEVKTELQSKTETDDKKKESASAEGWKVRLGGHVQLDYVTWGNASPTIVGDDNYFNYRRLRLVADGTGYEQFDFRLQMTLEPGLGSDSNQLGSPDVKDAYVSMNEIPVIGRLRIGNFFVPYGLEQVTNDTNNIFMERSIPTQGIFTPDREVGIAQYVANESQRITWSSGIFFDDINDTFKARFDDNQGLRISGRLTGLPYYDEGSNGRYLIHTGIGILHTHDQDDLVRFRARPQVQRGPILIDSGNLNASHFTSSNLELAVVWGRVTLQSEAYVAGIQQLSGQRVHAGGAYVHLSYFLTGESRTFEKFGQHGPQFGRNKPFNNFVFKDCQRGWGAWEAKTRWSYLELDDMNRGQYHDLTCGLNWYLSDRTRFMFDWIHPWTTSEAVFGETSSDLFAMRFDFNW